MRLGAARMIKSKAVTYLAWIGPLVGRTGRTYPLVPVRPLPVLHPNFRAQNVNTALERGDGLQLPQVNPRPVPDTWQLS